MLRACVIAFAFLTQACAGSACKVDADCSDGNLCATGFNTCRKACTQPIDCTGDTLCSPLANGLYACLKSNEIIHGQMTTSTDTSLGAQCDSPKNDGVSQPNEAFGACGDGAPLCNKVFTGDPSFDGADAIETCTTECTDDADCALKAPATCTGDCKAQFDNLGCFPSLPVNDTAQISGAKRANGQALTLYCRPRLFSYLVPKRCSLDADCGKTGSRAGDKCTKTTDNGGACLSGKLAAFECCQREGECDHAPGGDATHPLHCINSSDNLSGYCTRACNSDSDCPAGGSCWTNVYAPTTLDGQCTVVTLGPGQAVCRTTPRPEIPVPATKVVACNNVDRPVSKTDNTYDSSTRRCSRTF